MWEDTNEVREEVMANARRRCRELAQDGEAADDITKSFTGVTATERDLIFLIAHAEVSRTEALL